MKRIICSLAILFSPFIVFSQDISGLWKGTIFNDSTKQSLPYEVYITKEGGKLSGYSHTWFVISGQKCYGIKKVKVRIAKDGKVIIQDDALLVNNYPVLDKNVYQLNVLDLQQSGEEAVLNGPFATNRSKQYGELTGHINIKKVSTTTESALMQYLQRNAGENGIAAK